MLCWTVFGDQTRFCPKTPSAVWSRGSTNSSKKQIFRGDCRLQAEVADEGLAVKLNDGTQGLAEVVCRAGFRAIPMTVIGFGEIQKQEGQIIDRQGDVPWILIRKPGRDQFLVPLAALGRAELAEVRVFSRNADPGLSCGTMQKVCRFSFTERHGSSHLKKSGRKVVVTHFSAAPPSVAGSRKY